MKTGTPGTRPDSWRHTRAPLAPVRTHGGTHGHPWHPSGIQTGTRPELAPLAHLAPVRTHGGTRAPLQDQTHTRAPLQAVRSGTLAPVRPPDLAHTGTPGTLQGTGGIFAPDPGGRGRGGATTVAAGLA